MCSILYCLSQWLWEWKLKFITFKHEIFHTHTLFSVFIFRIAQNSTPSHFNFTIHIHKNAKNNSNRFSSSKSHWKQYLGSKTGEKEQKNISIGEIWSRSWQLLNFQKQLHLVSYSRTNEKLEIYLSHSQSDCQLLKLYWCLFWCPYIDKIMYRILSKK